jgi:thioredoxin 1
MALEFNDGNFEASVLNNDKVTIVDFWAVWCGPCKMVAPFMEQLAVRYAGQASVGKLDVDHNPIASREFGVRSIPTVLYFKNGVVVEKIVGAATMEKYEAALIKHLPVQAGNKSIS